MIKLLSVAMLSVAMHMYSHWNVCKNSAYYYPRLLSAQWARNVQLCIINKLYCKTFAGSMTVCRVFDFLNEFCCCCRKSMDEGALHAAAYRCRPSITNTRWYILGVNSATDGICIYTHICLITIQHNVQSGRRYTGASQPVTNYACMCRPLLNKWHFFCTDQ